MAYNKKMKRFRRRAKPYAKLASRGFRYARKYTSKGSAGYRALTLARKLADAVNIEYKTQIGTGTVNPTYSGTVVDLTSLIAQGSANGARIGDSLKLQNLTIRFYLEMDSTPASNEQHRVIIYRDQQNAITSGALMLQTTGNIFAPISVKNADNKYSSNILLDRHMTFANYAGGQVSRRFDVVIPLNFHVHYAAGTSTVKDNALKILFISDTVAASITAVRYYAQMSYTDD